MAVYLDQPQLMDLGKWAEEFQGRRDLFPSLHHGRVIVTCTNQVPEYGFNLEHLEANPNVPPSIAMEICQRRYLRHTLLYAEMAVYPNGDQIYHVFHSDEDDAHCLAEFFELCELFVEHCPFFLKSLQMAVPHLDRAADGDEEDVKLGFCAIADAVYQLSLGPEYLIPIDRFGFRSWREEGRMRTGSFPLPPDDKCRQHDEKNEDVSFSVRFEELRENLWQSVHTALLYSTRIRTAGWTWKEFEQNRLIYLQAMNGVSWEVIREDTCFRSISSVKKIAQDFATRFALPAISKRTRGRPGK